MSLTPFEAGAVAVPESTTITPGHVWTGFEWVSPERYKELGYFMDLPPIQEAPGNRTEDARGGVADNVPIPSGVWYSKLNDNFYATGKGGMGMGSDFYDLWCRRRSEFPDTFLGPNDVDLAKVETRVIAAAMEGTRVALPGAPLAPWDPGYVPPCPPPAPWGGVPPTAPPQRVSLKGGGYTGTGDLSLAAQRNTGRYHDPKQISPYMKQQVIEELLRLIVGEDHERGGLLETPARMVKAWEHWTSGYDKNPADILKVFEDGAEGVTEMVVVRDIPIYSKCEHHLADIFGTATIGYLPNGKIVGLSKLNRLADMYARRLQVQERMTNQIADAMVEHLAPLGCGVVITARHMCMESRGVQQSSNTTTSALRGLFKDDPTVRAEFLALARN